MKKVMIFGVAPWVPTGYGKTTKLLGTGLVEAGYDVTVAAYFGHTGDALTFNGMTVFPLYGWLNGEIPSCLAHLVNTIKPDVLIQHFDIWTLHPGWTKGFTHRPHVVSYSPVDSVPAPPILKRYAQEGDVDTWVAMSPHTERMLEDDEIDSTYIPHMYDPKLFYPLQDKQAIRKANFPQLPDDAVLFGFVGTNRSIRKGIPTLLAAFRHLAAVHPKVYLYLHTNMRRDEVNADGVDLGYLVNSLNLTDRVLHTEHYAYLYGLPDEALNILYNAFDYLVHPAMAEGFCIPIVEANACGVPTVVSYNSALRYTPEKSALKMYCHATAYMSVINAWHSMPNQETVFDGMERALRRIGTPKIYQKCVEDALNNAKCYTTAHILPKWQALLERI